jgi:hypothetical protein
MNKVKVGPADKQVEGHVVLKITDIESEFKGIEFYYDRMKFAEEENADGSLNMSFNYEVVTGDIPAKRMKDFEKFLGDQLIAILEDQIARGEVVFKGGSGNAIEL